jgi:hypothetical protein
MLTLRAHAGQNFDAAVAVPGGILAVASSSSRSDAVDRRKLSIGSLVLVGVAAVAFWLWRSGGSVERALVPASPPSETSPGEVARPAPTQPSVIQKAEVAESGAAPSEPISRKPTLDIPKLSPQEQQQLGEQALIGPHAWNRHIAPLLYPPGHPAEGTYLDTVTLDQAVAAQLRFYEEIIPGGEAYLNKPRLHIEKRFNYKELNERRRAWDSTDLQSTREFYDWMVAQPEDPNGRWGDIWLDADPADAQATTRGALLAERIRAREAPIFETR